jgi:LAO/AO transport system kinase
VAELSEKLDEHRAHIEAQGTLSERRRRNLMSEVLGLATFRMRRELEESIAEDQEVQELLDRVVSRELDPASAAGIILDRTANGRHRQGPGSAGE